MKTMNQMKTEMRTQNRGWYLPAITVALLLGVGAVTGSAFAAIPAGLPVGEASAIRPEPYKVGGPHIPLLTPTPCPPSWTQQVPYPIPILDNAVVAGGGFVYSFGGFSNNVRVANAYKYDPATNSWSAIASLPAVRSLAGAAWDGSNAYVLGGVDGVSVNNTLWRYNVAANTYTTLASFGTPTVAHAAAYLNGKIYKIGGCTVSNCGASTSSVEAYTISSNSWAGAAPLPQPIAFLMATALGGFVYAAGGAVPAETVKTYRYDPTTNAWNDAAIADLPAVRSGAASDVRAGQWVVAGGYSGGAVANTAISWDPGTNNWSSLDPMLQGRFRMGGGTVGSGFYVVGGRPDPASFTGTTDNQRYLPVACPFTPTNTPTMTRTITPTITPTPTNTPTSPSGGPSNTPTNTPTPILPSIFALKEDESNNQPLQDWTMNLYAATGSGPGCAGPVLATGLTDETGWLEFPNVTPGNYWVGEVLQPGWTPVTDACQYVTVSQDFPVWEPPAGSGGDVYPPAGIDSFPSFGTVYIDIPGVGADFVSVKGPTSVQRDDPCIGCGPGGRDTVATEMISMTMSGFSEVFGPIEVRVSPVTPTLGLISQQTPGVDFPADSYFDVFVEIVTPMGVLHNDTPLHVTAVLNSIPPFNILAPMAVSYTEVDKTPVAVYDSFGNLVGYLSQSHHKAVIPGCSAAPNTSGCVVPFRNRPDNTPTPTCTPPNYNYTTTSGGVIDPTGKVLVPGSQCDDCVVQLPMPFPYTLYGQQFNFMNASSNGNLQFNGGNPDFNNICLPSHTLQDSILAHWDDLRADCAGCGVYTSVSGPPGNRVLNIEWRAMYFNNPFQQAIFEARLFEGQNKFDIVYGRVDQNGAGATVGVQKDATLYREFSCDLPQLFPGLQLTFIRKPPCPTPPPINTPTDTPVPDTPQPTVTFTNTPTNTPTTGPVITLTPTPAGIVNGHLTWNGIGQPNSRNVGLTATVTLCNAGVPQNYVVTCDTNGNFSLTSGLPDGTYNWRIKGSRSLANSGALTIAGGAVAQEFGKMRAGDSNNNNVVNSVDFNILKSAFGTTGCPVPNAGWDARADFNNDCLVNSNDFTLQKNNFGFSGAAVNCP